MFGNGNCFTLSHAHEDGAKLTSGILALSPKHWLSVPMRNNGIRVFDVPVSTPDIVSPRGKGFAIFEADLRGGEATFGRDAPGFVPRNGFKVTILFIETSVGMYLNGGTSKPHFLPDTTLWLGAEGQRRPAHQVGQHADKQKSQLFRLEEGESILFFDDLHEVTKVTAQAVGQEPRIFRATNEEVANHVLWTAKVRGMGNRSTIGWCYHALQELGCQKQIDEFQQHFPNFRVRVK